MEERLTHIAAHSPLFSHDGIHDSQTYLAAPPYFYEQLRREVARATRSKVGFSLIKIIFEKLLPGGVDPKVSAEDILHFACELRAVTREQDCIGRLGINECIILMSDGEVAAQELITRLLAGNLLSVNNSLHISISMATLLADESALELLNRLDELPLSTH